MCFSRCKTAALSQCVSFQGKQQFRDAQFYPSATGGNQRDGLLRRKFRITDQNRFEKRIDAAR